MKNLLFVFALVTSVLASGCASQNQTEQDLAALQGTWKGNATVVEKTEKPSGTATTPAIENNIRRSRTSRASHVFDRIVVAGNQLRFGGDGIGSYKYSFILFPGSPQRIVLQEESTAYFGIYRIDGDILKIYFSTVGFPSAFGNDGELFWGGNRVRLLTDFVRQKP